MLFQQGTPGATTVEVDILSLNSLGSGKTTVTTAGTRVVLGSSTTIKSVAIKALSTNTGIIYVGNVTVAASNGFQLKANEAVSLDITNLATVYIDSSINAEGVTYIYAV